MVMGHSATVPQEIVSTETSTLEGAGVSSRLSIMSFQSAAALLRSAALIMTKSPGFRTTLLVELHWLKLNRTGGAWSSMANRELRRGAELAGFRSAPPRRLEDTMTTEQKIIRAKVGLLELAKQLGNVSQACKMMGFPAATASTASKNSTIKAASWHCRRSAARGLC
jgi:hypothetical protein